MRKLLVIACLALAACGGGGGGSAVSTGASPGAAPVSPAPSTPATPAPPNVQGDAVVLAPGDDLQAKVDAAPEGARFVFRPGLYRQATIRPKNNQTFVGEDGAVLSGAVTISGWRRQGTYWIAENYPAPLFSHGEGRNGMAQFREDLFIDGRPQLRVATLAEVAPGLFYYQPGGVVWIATDPTGRDTIALKTEAAFDGGSTRGVTIENLRLRHYASMAQQGAIQAQKTSGWVIRNVVAEFNHGAGVAAGSNMQIVGGSFSENGQIGVRAQDVNNLSIIGAEIAANNYAGFDEVWDSGGVKILTSTNVVIRDNLVAKNRGSGIWIDWENEAVTIENNYVHANSMRGIQYEASRRASIIDNVAEFNNTSGYDVGYWGSDILVQNASEVTVRGNHVASDVGQGIGLIYDRRNEGKWGPHNTLSNTVTRNTIVMVKSGLNGFAATADQSIMYNGSNSFDANTYIARSPQELVFSWNGVFFTAQEVAGQPFERSGVFQYVAEPRTFAKAGFLRPPASPPRATR